MAQASLSAIIDAIYAAALDHTAWEHAACLIKDHIGGHSVNLLVHDRDNFDVNFAFTTAMGDRETQFYLENILPHDDVNAIFDNMKPGAILSASVYSDDEFSRKFAYDHFYRQYGMDRFDSLLIEQSDSFRAFAGIARTRQERPFTEEDRARLAELLPHFRRALQINRTLSEHRVLASFGLESIDHLTVPVLLADTRARVILRNSAAEQAERDGYYQTLGSKIHLDDGDANGQLARILASPLADRAIDNTVRIRQAGKRGLLVCCPLQRQWQLEEQARWALFLLRDSSDVAVPMDWIRSVYDLTQAETRVLKHLLAGRATGTIARELNISRDGVKFHLRNLNLKTDTHGQVELILKLARSFLQIA